VIQNLAAAGGCPTRRLALGFLFSLTVNCPLSISSHYPLISSISTNSIRNFSNSFSLSPVAATSFFFHTNTSPLALFNFTLKFPPTITVTGDNSRKPPFSAGASTAAHSPRCTHNAFSYGGIAIGRNPAANSLSIILICAAVSSVISQFDPPAFGVRRLAAAFTAYTANNPRHFPLRVYTVILNRSFPVLPNSVSSAVKSLFTKNKNGTT
jgi:hypothetical protein